MKRKMLLPGLTVNLTALLCSMVFIIPLTVVFLNAFKTRAESNTMTLRLPTVWMIENFFVVIERGKLATSFLNSLLYAGSGAILIALVVSLAAFVLSRNHSRLNRFLYYFVILGIAMPMSYISLMKIMQITQLLNTRVGLILIYAAVNIPISLFIMYGFVRNISVEIDEAAIIDGCNAFALYAKVILPLLSPVIVTICILNFMAIWNDFTMPLYYLNHSSRWPMTLAVYNFFGMFENQWNYVSANIILTIAPVLLVFILGQKYIVDGISAGAVKG
ncbi:MAG: carbohydrate ABC transporter permease [Oscillospiraceae bacterium]|nr:carbohydrate ABC transporter permease [Oscillospiraceae bacterium]